MIDQVKKIFNRIANLPEKQQIELANLIEDEISWEQTFASSQEALAVLAKEAIQEYKSGKTSDQDWWWNL